MPAAGAWPRLLALTGTDEAFRVQASVAAAVAGIAAGGGIFGGGLRCALHALGGQRHRVRVPADRGRGSGGPGGSLARPDAPVTDSRAVAVWGQVAAHAAGHGRQPSVEDVCAVGVSSAALGGGWVVAARGGDPDFVMCVTGPVGEQLAEVQLMLGEGPCHDVLASAAPVLAADLDDAESSRRWPGFTPKMAARDLSGSACCVPRRRSRESSC
jgi:hypothetical protein